MKIALVHDFLVQNGGAERVLQSISELYPDAPIYTWFYDQKRIDPFFHTRDIRTSFVQNLPLSGRMYQWYLPLLPTATDLFDLNAYDVVISSTSSFIKGVITRPETLHIAYCHTPPRYLWSDTHEYRSQLKRLGIAKAILPLYLTRLRQYDLAASSRVDSYIANSHYVARRIKKYYQRESTVIYPPVEMNEEPTVSENFFLAGGRLMRYKRFDITIEAINRLRRPLKIFGDGPEYKALKKMAGPMVEFVGRVSEEEKKKLFARCLAFINPQVEDFGITAAEAMSAGKPVIGFRAGGNLETIVENTTGMFFDEQNEKSLFSVLDSFQHRKFDPQVIRKHAERFSLQRFKKELSEFVIQKREEFLR